jgi:uncharacterized protein
MALDLITKGDGLMEEIVSYFDTGEVSYTCEMKDGTRHGVERHFFKNGAVFCEGQLEEGTRVGRILEWNEEGTLVLSAQYSGGLLDGEYESRWESGILKEKGEFRAGKRAPGYTWYHTDGSVWKVL